MNHFKYLIDVVENDVEIMTTFWNIWHIAHV